MLVTNRPAISDAKTACRTKQPRIHQPWNCQGPSAGTPAALSGSARRGIESVKKIVDAISIPKSGLAAGGHAQGPRRKNDQPR
jgi:hypothetical protein